MTTPTSSSLPPPTPPPPKARALFRALLSVIFSYDPSAGWWSGVGWGGGWGGGGASSHAAVVPLAAQLLLLLLSRPGRFGAGEGAGGGGAGGGGTRGGGTEDRMSSLLSGLHGAETLGFICRGFSRLLGHRFVASAAYLPSLNSSKADTVRCVPELLALLWRYLSSNEGFVHATLESSESLPSLLLSLSLIALEGAADATAVSLVHMSTLCLLLLSTEAQITHTRHCFLPPPPPLVRARSCSPMCACVSRPMHSPPVSGTRHCFPRFQPGFGGASNTTLPPGTPLPPAHADATTLADLLVGLVSELVLGDNAGEGDSSPHRQVSHLQVSHPPQSFVLSFVGCSHVPLPFMHQPIGGFNRTQSISGLNQSADRSISGCNQPADSLLFFDSTDSSLSSLRRSPCSPTLRRTCAAGRLTHATSWFG